MLVFGNYGRQFILLISVVGVLSTINAGLMLTPRILFSMARDGLLPQRVTTVNKGGTPAVALFICSFASVILVLSARSSRWWLLPRSSSWPTISRSFAALLVLRRKEPDLARPYKACLSVDHAVRFVRFGGFSHWLSDWRSEHSLFTVILILLSYAAALLITRRKP